MAIKYAGTDLIGYGKAQVFKDRDVTKGIEIEAFKKRKKKEDNQKKLTDLINDVDYSNVRSADVPYFKDQFNSILTRAKSIVAQGGNPLTDLELRKEINQFKAHAITSKNGKETYNDNIKLTTSNKDYMNEGNVNALILENSAPMFGDNASYFSTDARGTEGGTDYVAGSIGNRANLIPNLGVETHYKNNIENLKLHDVKIEETEDGGFKYKASNGSYRTFKTKSALMDDQVTSAAKNILANHPYPDAFYQDQENAAIAGGFVNEDDSADVLGYISDQIRQRTGETKVTGFVDKKVANTYVSMSSGTETAPASGEVIPVATYEFTGMSRTINGVATQDYNPSYSTIEVPAVYKDVVKDGKTTQELVSPKKVGQTFDFGQGTLDIRPTKTAGFMVYGQREDKNKKPLDNGYITTGENINFVPNSIVFNNTAKKDFDVTINGQKHTIKQGEVIDDAALKVMSEWSEIKRNATYEPKPWLQGKDENGLTVSIGFDESVQARFGTFVNTSSGKSSTRKQNRALYEKMMKNIGLEAKGASPR
tara:strand:+ start:268 stop:1878 length:1611 start_codon:yes stop_codon:yes gene_type:complete